jgi:O-antigen/teichoic acid export membrane protein
VDVGRLNLKSMLDQLRGRFARDVMTLTIGTVVAQGVNVLAAPAITRIFSPDIYGAFTLYSSIVLLMAVLATLKIDVAVAVAKEESDAFHLGCVAMLLATVVCGVSSLIIALFEERVSTALEVNLLGGWLHALPISLFLTVLFQVLSYWSNRKRQYRTMAVSRSSQALIMAGATIGLGLAGYGVGALVIGMMLGLGAGCIAQLVVLLKEDAALFSTFSVRGAKASIKSYWPLVRTLFVSHTIAAARTQVPIWGMSRLYSVQEVGYFSLAQRVLGLPSATVANAVGDVFRQRAVDAYKTRGRFDDLLRKTVKFMVCFGLVPYLVLILVAPHVIEFIFGRAWMEVATYILISSASSFAIFVFSPVDKAALIFQAKGYILFWQIGSLVLTAAAVATAYFAAFDIKAFLIALSVVQAAYWVFDFFAEHAISKGQPSIFYKGSNGRQNQ